jgi:hypothetical protein
MNLKLIRSVAFATWLYSLLFLIYLTFRLTFNSAHVQLDDLFIDHLPYFTFLVTGICMLAINLTSLALYLKVRTILRRTGSALGKEADRPFTTRSTAITGLQKKEFHGHPDSLALYDLNIGTFIIWLFSISVWIYLSYQSLTHPPSPPYWPISMLMFVISYFCMVFLFTPKESNVVIGSS